MLKAVLFDMDGVIVDTEPLHYKAYHKMFKKVGIDVSSDMYEGFTGQSTYGICKQLCTHFNLVQDPQELVKIKRNYFTKLFFDDEDLKLLDGYVHRGSRLSVRRVFRVVRSSRPLY